MQLCEAETPNSWRASRPADLPFSAPPQAAVTRPWPTRRYEWPQSGVTRQRSGTGAAAAETMPYWRFSSSPHQAKDRPIVELFAKAQGLELTSSDDRMQADEVRAINRSSSSSAGGRADDEHSSGQDPPLSSSAGTGPSDGTLHEVSGAGNTQDPDSPPELPSSDEDMSDEELAKGLEEELKHMRYALIKDLFAHVMESDDVGSALRTLRREGVKAIDPLIDAQLDSLDHHATTLREWCQEVGVSVAV